MKKMKKSKIKTAVVKTAFPAEPSH